MIPLKDDIPRSTFPFITIAIILINIIVFVYQLSIGDWGERLFIVRAGAIPYEISHLRDLHPPNLVPIPFTIFTALFIHGGIAHLAGNMIYLWIFGDNIEDKLGHLRFLLFYLIAGMIATLAHVLLAPASHTPMIGASGAIAGILGAYLILFPRATVSTLIFLFIFIDIVKIPALVFLVLWFAFQLMSSGHGGNIAWYAHIGGFIAGVILIKLFMRRKGK
ncbi:MAG: rhomboid family intramembrane serine protease [Zetaproteobacteria bacterium]|jgi:membrane associated rhomboid family serine protease|nr:rhomboid family intramembrane serine protease [Zetaproteobacteria bacterium]